MKIPKLPLNKKTAIIAPIVSCLVIGGIVIAQPDSKTDNSSEVKKVSAQNVKDVESQPETEAQPIQQQVASQTVTVPQEVAPSPTAPQPSQPQPETIYEPDQQNPGYFVVTNKEKAMEQAGIALGDYNYVISYIARISGWRFNPDGSHSLCNGIGINSGLADWKTNPVTQLKLCNEWAISSGGWANIYQERRR